MTNPRALGKNEHVVEGVVPYTFALRTYIPIDPSEAHDLANGRKLCEEGARAMEWLLESRRSFHAYTVDNALMIRFDNEEDAALFKLFCF